MYRLNVTYAADTREQLTCFLGEILQQGLADASREEEGCIRYDYYFAVEKENELLLIEYWTSKEAQKYHCTLPHFKKIGELKEKYQVSTTLVEL